MIDENEPLEKAASNYGLPENFILYLGTIEPRKNLPLLIKSYKRLVDSGTKHKLVLVGKYGWMYKEVLNLVDELNLTNWVYFTGYIPQEDLPLVYNLATLFVYPTIYEGFGLPVLEAMACGVPVITSQISSLPEIVGDAGVLIPVSDAGALYDAMDRLLQNKSLRDELIKAGLTRAKTFSWERTAQLTCKIYQKVLGSSKT